MNSTIQQGLYPLYIFTFLVEEKEREPFVSSFVFGNAALEFVLGEEVRGWQKVRDRGRWEIERKSRNETE